MTVMRRFSENILVKGSFIASLAAIGAVGAAQAAVDLTEVRRASAMVVADTGASATTLDIKLQESADASTWSDVTSGAFTQIAASASDVIKLMDIDCAKRKKYVRIYYTVGGGALGYLAGSLFLFGLANVAPTQDTDIEVISL